MNDNSESQIIDTRAKKDDNQVDENVSNYPSNENVPKLPKLAQVLSHRTLCLEWGADESKSKNDL